LRDWEARGRWGYHAQRQFAWNRSLALLPVVLFVVDRHVIAREERYLKAKFGDECRKYKRNVGGAYVAWGNVPPRG
jgi:protein-S-isoprenylcysteine O-methyltransferase Ste14